MNNEDIHRVEVAAADMENAQYELDRATLDFNAAVATALREGEVPSVIAEAAGLDEDELLAPTKDLRENS